MSHIYFISGIDTDCGKTYITSQLAALLHQKGASIITQKLAQTGCKGISEDILSHRKVMGISFQDVDMQGLTCPYVFAYASSPHVAAAMEGKKIELQELSHATNQLMKQYDTVLLEGVGGLCVPLNHETLLVDYVAGQNYPLILIASSKLGSINHTILSLEICKQKHIPIVALVYNSLPDTPNEIAESSYIYLQEYCVAHFPQILFVRDTELEKLARLL